MIYRSVYLPSVNLPLSYTGNDHIEKANAYLNNSFERISKSFMYEKYKYDKNHYKKPSVRKTSSSSSSSQSSLSSESSCLSSSTTVMRFTEVNGHDSGNNTNNNNNNNNNNNSNTINSSYSQDNNSNATTLYNSSINSTTTTTENKANDKLRQIMNAINNDSEKMKKMKMNERFGAMREIEENNLVNGIGNVMDIGRYKIYRYGSTNSKEGEGKGEEDDTERYCLFDNDKYSKSINLEDEVTSCKMEVNRDGQVDKFGNPILLYSSNYDIKQKLKDFKKNNFEIEKLENYNHLEYLQDKIIQRIKKLEEIAMKRGNTDDEDSEEEEEDNSEDSEEEEYSDDINAEDSDDMIDSEEYQDNNILAIHRHKNINKKKVFLKRKTGNTQFYKCNKCFKILQYKNHLISKKYMGQTGSAMLIYDLNNVKYGECVSVKMMTGVYECCNIYCLNCSQYIGWKYLKASSLNMKYKEGLYIIENNQISTK